MTETRLYGNKYGVLEMMNDLTKACFAADASNPNTFRQNLHTLYAERLISLFKSGAYDAQSQAAALAQLKQILNFSKAGSNEEAKAHYANLKLKIDQAMALK